MESLGIIGAGAGGTGLLKTFLANPNVRILGIADPNPDSPGIVLAKEHRIFTTKDFRDLLRKPGRKMLFDATGIPAVAAELAQAQSETIRVIPPDLARLIWELVEAKEQTNHILLKESDSLLRFIEEGLTHLDTLSTKHSADLQKTVEKIRTLSELTNASQALVQETEQIMHLVKNVADQTRMLGINASIESARAGDFGRGFGVVANSIHELSASSLRSVNSVSGTINGISQALQNIDDSVNRVAQDILRIEANQSQLAEELHSSLEEMVHSAENLARLGQK